jgi:NADPH:quinone reductase
VPALPDQMPAIVLAEGGVAQATIARPIPRRGEVLVRVAAAPINPNDLMMIDGRYEITKPVGAVCGLEGSGTVVASGGGLFGRFLLGRRVAFAAGEGDGSWAEYARVPVMRCAPLDRRVDLRQGAMLLTNPMTATVLVQTAVRGGHRALVLNAAAGALGKMIVRRARREGLALVAVVRRAEQADVLRELGAEHVVIAGNDDAQLRELCERLDVRFALDAIGGDATAQLAHALRPGGTIVVYGNLSRMPCRVDADDLLFHRLTVRGFTMYEWLERTSLFGQLRALRAAQRGLADDLRSEIRATFPLSAHAEALALARGSTSEGKLLFVAE